MEIKNTIQLIVEELLKYDDIIKNSNTTCHFSINGDNIIEIFNYIKFEKIILKKVEDEIKKIKKIESFNFTITMRDTADIYREEYPLNWYTSNLIFYCGKESEDDCYDTVGLMDFYSENIQLHYKNGCEKIINTENEVIEYIKSIFDLNNYYVAINNEIANKTKAIFNLGRQII